MNYAVVTSCSAEGWRHYGQRFVHTFLKFWPREVELIVASENLTADQAFADEYDWPRDFTHVDLRDNAAAFIERYAKDDVARGRRQMPGQRGWTPKKLADGYNFRYDAARFALKVFSIAAAASLRSCGKLFWIDADVVTFTKVPMALLEETLPRNFALSCLDRGETYHSECGYVGYDLDHPQTRPFIAAFLEIYQSDRFRELAEWHDSWIFDWIRRQNRVPTHCIPHKSMRHPFVNSPALSTYMDHCKGSRKDMGRTPKHERNIRDSNAYWA